ncbi:hypothetical protein RFI_32606, partial [Reticulomyxa filosa]
MTALFFRMMLLFWVSCVYTGCLLSFSATVPFLQRSALEKQSLIASSMLFTLGLLDCLKREEQKRHSENFLSSTENYYSRKSNDSFQKNNFNFNYLQLIRFWNHNCRTTNVIMYKILTNLFFKFFCQKRQKIPKNCKFASFLINIYELLIY